MKLVNLLFAVALAATPLSALAQPSAKEVAEEARFTAEMRLMSVQMQPVQATALESMTLFNDISRQMAPAAELLKRGAPKAEVDRWVASWKPDFTARSAALRQRAGMIKGLNKADYPVLLARPSDGGDVDALFQGPARARAVIVSTLDLCDSLAAEIEKGAAGDPRALERAGRSTISGFKALVQTENINIDLTLAGLPPTTPDRPFMRAIKESNLSILALAEGMQGRIDGRAVDGKVVGQSMHTHIAEGRRNVTAMTARASAIQAQLDRSPPDIPGMADRLRASLGTYKSSAAVENQIFEVFDDVASKLEAGGDLLQLGGSLDALSPLANQRADIQRRRLAALGR